MISLTDSERVPSGGTRGARGRYRAKALLIVGFAAAVTPDEHFLSDAGDWAPLSDKAGYARGSSGVTAAAGAGPGRPFVRGAWSRSQPR